MSKRVIVVVLCVLGMGVFVLTAQVTGAYHLLKKVPLGAAEGGGEYFDYITIDGAARRAYLSHGTEVLVLDADSNKVIGKVTGLKRDHGIAVVPVIDPVKGEVITTIPLGGAPEQAVADGKGMIYDNLEDTNEVIAIDARTLKIQSRWPVAPAGQPVAIAMD